MTTYQCLRAVHIACVALSVAGFTLRGLLMLRDSRWLQHRLARVLPHLNDTVLLAAAIGLALMSGQYPFVAPWLTAKLAGLVLYIVLGTLALRPGRSKGPRTLAFAAALVTVAWVISVAISRDPAGFFTVLKTL